MIELIAVTYEKMRPLIGRKSEILSIGMQTWERSQITEHILNF